MPTKFKPLRGVIAAACVVWGLASARDAHAERIGLVVGGEVSKAPYVIDAITPWLEQHGHTPVLDAVDDAGRTALVGCFLDDDDACAATLVRGARAAHQIDQLIFVMVDLQQVDAGGRTRDNVTLTGLAFAADGSQTRTDRRFCEDCGAPTLATAAADLAGSLIAAAAGTSRVDVRSTPPGAALAVDGTAAGTTPAALDLAPGAHRLELRLDGHAPLATDLTVAPGDAPRAVDLTLVAATDAPPPGPRRPSRRLPFALIGGGAALAITGGVLIAIDEDSPGSDGKRRAEYRDSALAGVGLGATGLAVASVGIWLLLRPQQHNAPVISASATGASVGWASTF